MSFSYNPPRDKCKKCGKIKMIIEPTCGFGWGFMLDGVEDIYCHCNATVITRFPKEEDKS